MKKNKIVIFGDSAFAEVAYEMFTHDSEYEVVAFTVDRAFLQKDTLFGLPIVPFDEVAALYPPDAFGMFIALVYNHMNTIREAKYHAAKAKGYALVNYVSSRAFVWHNVQLGDNVCIFENNVIQPFVTIGNNTILWSGNHIGHHSSVGDHCFIASHAVISGFVSIANNCFIGVNATLVNNIAIEESCFIGAGALIINHLTKGSRVKGAEKSKT